jgi:hypothetical protein
MPVKVDSGTKQNPGILELGLLSQLYTHAVQ